LNLGAVPVDVWSPLVTQLGLPVALVCFLVWQWAERDKLTQDRFTKLDSSTTERERENASRIMKLEDTMQNALRLALDESSKAIVRNTEALARVENSLTRVETVMERGLCPLATGDVAAMKDRHAKLAKIAESVEVKP
jgi:hypothetical protein